MLLWEEQILPFHIFVSNEEGGLLCRSTEDHVKVPFSSDIPLSQDGSAQGQTVIHSLLCQIRSLTREKAEGDSQLLNKTDSFAFILKPPPQKKTTTQTKTKTLVHTLSLSMD